VGALAGCGDSAGTNDGGASGQDMAATVSAPTNFASVNDVLQFSCTFSSCHTSGNAKNAGNLNLQNDPVSKAVVSWDNLVNQTPDNPRAKNEGQVRVKPCDADASFLIYKLTKANTTDESDATHYGKRMPEDSDPLDAVVIQGIKDWINRGALKDEPAAVTGSTCTLKDGGT
jgi:hypothetical protein